MVIFNGKYQSYKNNKMKEYQWNYNKKVGWQKFKELTEQENKALTYDPTSCMNDVAYRFEENLTKIKHKSFGKCSKRDN